VEARAPSRWRGGPPLQRWGTRIRTGFVSSAAEATGHTSHADEPEQRSHHGERDIYEAVAVKAPVRGFCGRRFRTFPSPSASVDLPISAAAGRRGLAVFRIFLEPEVEGDSGSLGVLTSGADLTRNAQTSIRDHGSSPRPTKKTNGCRHSECRASLMGTRPVTHSGSSAVVTSTRSLTPHASKPR
jgi:hypothetical protein